MSPYWFNSFAVTFSCTLVILLSCSLPFLCVSYKLFKSPVKLCTAPRFERDATQCRVLLKQSTLEQKATPNNRLVKAFGINNSFTTIDKLHAERFIKRSKALLVAQCADWKDIKRFASTWMEQYALIQLETNSSLNLLQTTQGLVFQVVVHKFFPSVPTPSHADVKFIATEINELWLASKGDMGQVELIKRDNLNFELRSTFGIRHHITGEEGEENPLNILLPAYETMWRIVLRTFLEVRFRSTHHQREQYALLLAKFCEDPTRGVFEQTVQMEDGQSISVKAIVMEGLRLYPPTKRIYRQLETEEVAVDIEYLHRDINEWGDDALEFVPGRWETSHVKGVEKRGYFLPFGAGRFECPARPQFGPFTIGILVGVLVAEFGAEYELVDDGGELEGEMVPLDNGRDAYGGLKLLGVRAI